MSLPEMPAHVKILESDTQNEHDIHDWSEFIRNYRSIVDELVDIEHNIDEYKKLLNNSSLEENNHVE